MKKSILILGLLTIMISLSAQTAAQNFELYESEAFQKRVQMLSLQSATQIIGEDLSTFSAAQVAKRHDFAMKVLEDPNHCADIIARVCAAQGTLTSESNDGDIQYTINTIWNDLAGVKYDD